MEMQRHCTYCGTEIESGFVCKQCKTKVKQAGQGEAQKKYYEKRKAEMAKLREDNEKMRKLIEELKNAN